MNVFRTHHPRSEAASTLLAENSPALWGLLLWAEHLDDPLPEQGTRTNGTTVWYDTIFAKMPVLEQIFACAHEILHVALCHPIRGRKLRLREGQDYDRHTWNVVCDALVNAALLPQLALQWMRPPAQGIVTLDELEKYLHKAGWKGQLTADSFDAEGLYQLLKQHGVAKTITVNIDVDVSGGLSGEADDDQTMRDWERRISAAAVGDKPGGILRKLTDLPKVETPWERVLRTTLMSALVSTTEESWARPSRRWLALHKKMPIPYTPGVIAKPRPTFGVVLDSSGSIDDDLFARFVAEIHSIHDKTGARLVVIVADAEVQSLTVIEEQGQQISRVEWKGGGGTDFQPALAALAEYQPACCVYLTDLMGTMPNKPPKFKTIWAVPAMYQTLVATENSLPFGKLLYIK